MYISDQQIPFLISTPPVYDLLLLELSTSYMHSNQVYVGTCRNAKKVQFLIKDALIIIIMRLRFDSFCPIAMGCEIRKHIAIDEKPPNNSDFDCKCEAKQ